MDRELLDGVSSFFNSSETGLQVVELTFVKCHHWLVVYPGTNVQP